MATPALVWGPLPDKPPGPPQTPATITGPPALISRTTTTLTINILIDQPVQAWLEYGTTASLGAETTHETSYLTSHTQVISGLSAGITYHVRAHVVNQSGIHTLSAVYLFTTVSSGITLQALIDGTSPGGTADATGISSTVGVIINKALTLVNGTVAVSSGAGINVTADDVTIDGTTITGPGNTTVYADTSRGIQCIGTSGSRITGLVVRNCTISLFRRSGIYLRFTTAPLIELNTVTDCVYIGIEDQSGLNSIIQDNVVRRIGDKGVYPSAAAIYNAYGIVETRYDFAHPVSSGCIIRRNTVSDVPTWHGLDTHGGTNLQWIGNHVSRCNRAIFITSSSSTSAGPQVISGNYLDEPTRRPDVQNTYPYNMRGLTMASGSATGTGNTFDGWPATSNGAISLEGGTATLTNTTIINSF